MATECSSSWLEMDIAVSVFSLSAPTPVSHQTPAEQQHVFISYSWANQKEVIKIKDKLKVNALHCL